MHMRGLGAHLKTCSCGTGVQLWFDDQLGPDVLLASAVHLGLHAYLGPGVPLGPGVHLRPGVLLGRDVHLCLVFTWGYTLSDNQIL